MTSPATLDRRLSLSDAVVIGLGSMIGAGVFVVFAPAAAAAGTWLFAALALVAVIAWCNARSTAQLAARHPTSGGAYADGRAELGPTWGFAAGWCFVVGKTASCAAMALAFAEYAAPDGAEPVVAVAAVVLLTVVNALGVSKTAAVTRVIVVLVLVTLAVVVAAGFAGPPGGAADTAGSGVSLGPAGVLQAAGLLFFAFAGYARIATLGEEVANPERTIPLAVTISFALALAVYALVAFVCVQVLGVSGLAASSEPLADVVGAAGWDGAVPVVRVGAALASLGALLGLMAGIGRTTLAMAREGDMPRWLAAVSERSRVPVRAELVLGCVVVALVLFADVPTAVALSSVGVLLYYAVANVSAVRLATRSRGVVALRATAVLGAVGCVVLAAALPPFAVAVGVGVIALGVVVRTLIVGRRSATAQ